MSNHKPATNDVIEMGETSIIDKFKDGHHLRIYHAKRAVDSTQDEAKLLLQQHYDNVTSSNLPENDSTESNHFAVIADTQTNARGTSGRKWVATYPGNLYMTYCLPMDDILMSKITLLPLAVGVTIAETMQQYISSKSQLSLKWPNDVLLNDKKVAGTLIENYAPTSSFNETRKYWLLIGVGINLMSHPQDLPPETDAKTTARTATCLKEYMTPQSTNIPSAVDFGIGLSQRIQQLVLQGELGHHPKPLSTSIIDKWRTWARMGQIYTIRQTGEQVTTIDVEKDGQLRVMGNDGKERLLVSDYFV